LKGRWDERGKGGGRGDKVRENKKKGEIGREGQRRVREGAEWVRVPIGKVADFEVQILQNRGKTDRKEMGEGREGGTKEDTREGRKEGRKTERSEGERKKIEVLPSFLQ
jgi:hypothetical protein